MALTYGFFNSVEGDRLYTAEQIGKFLHGLVSSGVYADKSDSLQVMAAGGMTVTVRPGRGMLDYHWLEVDEPYGLALAAGGALPRVDGIVMRLDMVNRRIELAVTQGAPSNTPAVPAVVRTDAIKEYLLAKISVPALATEITQANITDTRGYDYVCGWVSGLIKQVSTETLFLQWQTAYEEAYAELGNYLDAQKAAWEMFFANVTEDNVLPAPALDDTGKVPRVNAAADGYVLAPVYAENLLGNSDFTKPVNRRGAAVYTGTNGTPTPALDRWKLVNGTTLTVSNGCITVTPPADIYTGGIEQHVPVNMITAGGKYTVAVKMGDGKVYAGTVTAPSASADGTGVRLTDVLFASLQNDGVETDCRLFFRTDNTTVDIVWAALYEGEYTADTLPVYHARGYAAELAAAAQCDSATTLPIGGCGEMIEGVEYVTTEFFAGRPVYTQLIKRTWAKGTVITIPFAENLTPHRYCGSVGTWTLPFLYTGKLDGGYSAIVTVHKNNDDLKIAMYGGDSVAGTLLLQIWYCKK